MQINRYKKYSSAFLAIVFVAFLATETLHFILIEHETNITNNSENKIVSQKLSNIHSCDFKFLKTPFKFDTELHIKPLATIFIGKEKSFSKNELAKSSIKSYIHLRGPPKTKNFSVT